MKGKRFLGIPVSIIAIVLAVMVVAGGVYAAIVITKDIPATVTIKGYGLEVYADQACTIPLTSLSYTLPADASATNKCDIWCKNTGTDNLWVGVASTSISGLTHCFKGPDVAQDIPNAISPNEVKKIQSWFEKTGTPDIGEESITITVQANNTSS